MEATTANTAGLPVQTVALEGCELMIGLLLTAKGLMPDFPLEPATNGPSLKVAPEVMMELKHVLLHWVRMVLARKTPPSPKLKRISGGAHPKTEELEIRRR